MYLLITKANPPSKGSKRTSLRSLYRLRKKKNSRTDGLQPNNYLLKTNQSDISSCKLCDCVDSCARGYTWCSSHSLYTNHLVY